MEIRLAREDDANRLLEIYSYYVKESAITFEWDVPSLMEFKNRIDRISVDYPYLVAVEDGSVIGYAYASPYSFRKAYSWSVECSIYIDKNKRHHGTGHMLLHSLENELRRQNVIKMLSCIATTDREDRYLTNASVYFHRKEGFKECGRIENAGYKFNRWWDIVWMEKDIKGYTDSPNSFIPYSKIIH